MNQDFVPTEKIVCKSKFSFFIHKLKLALTLLRSEKTILITDIDSKNIALNRVNLRPGEVLQRCEMVYNNMVADMDAELTVNNLFNELVNNGE